MNFSKTTEYALRILSHMAGDVEKKYSADDLYDYLKIPYRYLRKQLTILTKSGLLISIQGKGGGYRISKNLTEISLYDIVVATGDSIINKDCFFGFQDCALEEKCVMHDKWISLQENINNVLVSTKLESIKKILPQNSISKTSIFT
jgi:Rrf2 family protein